MPNTVCGYVGSQLRSAYDIPAGRHRSRRDDSDHRRLRLVDHHLRRHQVLRSERPERPVEEADLTKIDQGPFDNEAVCGASGWQDEEAIDIESAHSMAPGSHVLFVGAKSCYDQDLFNAEQAVIDGGLANVISNSWGDDAGDLLDDAATHTAYDDLFMLADATGITVQFSSGDNGDNFDLFGFSSPDFPTDSPYVTSVGGTSLEIGSTGRQIASYGWSTAKSVKCEANVAFAFSDCTSANYGTYLTPTYDGSSGGYTSYYYTQPWYQAPVVPTSLSERNSPIYGPVPQRVDPDISLTLIRRPDSSSA